MPIRIRKRHVLVGAGALLAALYLRGKRPETVLAALMLELPARTRPLTQLAQDLERSGTRLDERLRGLPDTPENREQLRHIISLERWGTRRLRVLLGERYERDSSRAYRPEEGLDWAGLQLAHAEARRELLGVARSLEEGNRGHKVEHNQFGPLSAGGWLRYLDTHATLESRRLK